MLAGNTLTDFTNLFPPNNFKRNDDIFLKYFTVNVQICNSHETHNVYANVYDQQQFRLNKIKKIKDFFGAEIKDREN